MDLSAALHTFIEEARELLASMEDSLLAVEAGRVGSDEIGALFRAAHTIKGSAGLFGLTQIVAFTHHVESVMDRVRAGSVPLDPPLAELLLRCRDYIATLVDEVVDEKAHAAGPLEARLVAELGAYLGVSEVKVGSNLRVTRQPEHWESSGGGQVDTDCWHLSLRFGSDVLRMGMDPLSFLRYLGRLGRIVQIATLWERLPGAAEMDAEACYLGFELSFQTDCDKVTIEEVFEFVRDDAVIHILPPHSKIDEYVRLIAALPNDKLRLGEILLNIGTLTPRELDVALSQQKTAPQTAPLGKILIEEQVVAAPVIAAALDKQRSADERKQQEHKLVKVEAAKLDNLINLVGEMVIAGAATHLLAGRAKDPELNEAMSVMNRLVELIRDGALKLRMGQIGETFNRFPRVVRDVSKELGKHIELQISGSETELDKSMVEKIADPLMHLVRNAIDHGIEAPALRLARGKPEQGTIRLNAYHDSGSIVIEVGDDGGGLNRDKIRAKAIANGLIAADTVLSDQELMGLIFEAGFSTAEAVTNLSGRGVGMDVVKRNVEALRGTIDISSQEGIGTTMHLRLPLTMAIIDGFLVRVGASVFVIPLDMVVECVELPASERDVEREYINLRGHVLPFLRLRTLFDLEGQAVRRENIVVVRYGNHRAGLVVDDLLGECQAVIKPLGQLFRQAKGLAGSTILGNGEVALILDVQDLIRLTEQAPQRGAGSSRRGEPLALRR